MFKYYTFILLFGQLIGFLAVMRFPIFPIETDSNKFYFSTSVSLLIWVVVMLIYFRRSKVDEQRGMFVGISVSTVNCFLLFVLIYTIAEMCRWAYGWDL